MKDLLKLARNSIECEFNGKKVEIDEEIKKKYSEKQACFVTLTIHGELRGCIGSLIPRQKLYLDVIENAKHAAFHDFRFHPLRKEELDKIKIEISVLTIPKELNYKDSDDLLKKINSKMGIILKKNGRSSTFLPQVWEQLPDKVDFLEHLSMKAGLDKDSWKDADIEYYEVKSVEEE